MIVLIGDADLDLTKKMFDVLCVPYYVAPCEAERYASSLCVLGLVDGVLSEDTDVMVYGTSNFLSSINTYTSTVVEVNHDELLSGLSMTHETFRDMCILLGCDYNSSIPSCGMKTVFRLIKEFQKIEPIVDLYKSKGITTDELKFDRCRELFSVDRSVTYNKVPLCACPDFNAISIFFYENGIDFDLRILKNALGFRRDITFL
jgi:5'-3' exonuclease